jgi:hypothetical protein
LVPFEGAGGAFSIPLTFSTFNPLFVGRMLDFVR